MRLSIANHGIKKDSIAEQRERNDEKKANKILKRLLRVDVINKPPIKISM